MTPFNIECTDCGATLKISDPSHIGKLAKCPKCRGLVKVTPPDDGQFLSDFDSNEFEDLPYEPDPEPKKTPRPKKKPKPTTTRRPGDNPMARAGVVAAIILGVVAGIYFAGPALNLGDIIARLGGSSGISPDLTWLPDGVTAVSEIRVSQVVQTPAVTEALKRPEAIAGVAMMTGTLGFNLHDVDSLRFGMFSTINSIGENRIGGVVKLLKPGKVASVLEGQTGSTPPGASRVAHGSRWIYTLTGLPQVSICCVDDQTILFGGVDELKSVLDKDGKPESTSRFGFLDKQHQMMFLIAPKDLKAAGYIGGAPLNFFKETDTTGIAVCIDLDSLFRGTMLVPCISSKAARQGKEGFDRGFQQSIRSPTTVAMLDPEVQKALSSIKSTISGRVLSMTAELPMDRVVAALENLADESPAAAGMPFKPRGFSMEPPNLPATERPITPTIEVVPSTPLQADGATPPATVIPATPAPVAPVTPPAFPSQRGSTPPRPGVAAPPPPASRPSGF